MSVRPSSEMFCTIMSTFTPASASGPKIEAATPGRSATPSSVTFASSRWNATPLTTLLSMMSSSSHTSVPGPSSNDDSTLSRTLWRIASSTERVWSTLAPSDASSSISS